LADRKVNVAAGHLLVLDCGVLHDVEALGESALLLTISTWTKRLCREWMMKVAPLTLR